MGGVDVLSLAPYSLYCGKQPCFAGMFAFVKSALFFRLANCDCLF